MATRTRILSGKGDPLRPSTADARRHGRSPSPTDRLSTGSGGETARAEYSRLARVLEKPEAREHDEEPSAALQREIELRTHLELDSALPDDDAKERTG